MSAKLPESANPSRRLFSGNRGIRLLGLKFTVDGTVKGFFGGNAYLAIIFLLFICLFLLRAAMGFFPGYRTELHEARQSGVEFVNVIKQETAGFTALRRKMDLAYISEKRARFGQQEATILLYNRFEGVVDDHLENQVEALAEMDPGTQYDQKEAELKTLVREQCLSLPSSEIEQALSPLGLQSAPKESTEQAVALAIAYAVNDAETPDEVDAISEHIRSEMGAFTQAFEAVDTAGKPLQELESQLSTQAQETVALLRRQREIPTRIQSLREGAQKINDPVEREEKLQTAKQLEAGLAEHIDVTGRARVFYDSVSKHQTITQNLFAELGSSIALIPSDLSSPEARQSVAELKTLLPAYQTILIEKHESLSHWDHNDPVTILSSIKAFFFGTEWQTNSSWQNVYGVLPLLSGSLLIAGVALFFAVPVAIGAALYVNQFSYRKEAALLKPTIEFVQAIPSVVLGLFGVLVLAGWLKDASAHPLLSWIPGFPIQERLNVLLAALLLAFMAAPTIFTLAEDALNNVPKAYSEASLAMGATKLQTALKVVLPSALSGIIAAILLGFGRVIGETMVVLLVAGNKAAIPDFSQGIAVATQPVHTMTSIIAQECGEVETGSLHYMALFMVGLILFLISLSVNSYCQRILKKKMG